MQSDDASEREHFAAQLRSRLADRIPSPASFEAALSDAIAGLVFDRLQDARRDAATLARGILHTGLATRRAVATSKIVVQHRARRAGTTTIVPAGTGISARPNSAPTWFLDRPVWVGAATGLRAWWRSEGTNRPANLEPDGRVRVQTGHEPRVQDELTIMARWDPMAEAAEPALRGLRGASPAQWWNGTSWIQPGRGQVLEATPAPPDAGTSSTGVYLRWVVRAGVLWNDVLSDHPARIADAAGTPLEAQVESFRNGVAVSGPSVNEALRDGGMLRVLLPSPFEDVGDAEVAVQVNLLRAGRLEPLPADGLHRDGGRLEIRSDGGPVHGVAILPDGPYAPPDAWLPVAVLVPGSGPPVSGEITVSLAPAPATPSAVLRWHQGAWVSRRGPLPVDDISGNALILEAPTDKEGSVWIAGVHPSSIRAVDRTGAEVPVDRSHTGDLGLMLRWDRPSAQGLLVLAPAGTAEPTSLRVVSDVAVATAGRPSRSRVFVSQGHPDEVFQVDAEGGTLSLPTGSATAHIDGGPPVAIPALRQVATTGPDERVLALDLAGARLHVLGPALPHGARIEVSGISVETQESAPAAGTLLHLTQGFRDDVELVSVEPSATEAPVDLLRIDRSTPVDDLAAEHLGLSADHTEIVCIDRAARQATVRVARDADFPRDGELARHRPQTLRLVYDD